MAFTGRRQLILAGGALLALYAAPALADVKAGVDAWSRGEYAAAVREWVGPAEAGDPDAQFNLAQAYRLGRGVEADSAQAEALYAKAASKGHVQAADNYGLLLFQAGRRQEAMPFVQSAAGRGDPRAQYLLGIAHFNGDLVAKDWRRAYALVSLANAVGLPQARAALEQMDGYIPIEQRQEAQTLAAALKTEAEAARARELAAVDLALGASGVTSAPPLPSASASAAPAVPVRASTATLPPRSNGAVIVATLPASSAPVRESAAVVPAPSPAPATPTVASIAPAKAPAATGPWKIQLGAFGVAGNADRLWAKLAGRSELAGRPKIKQAEGRLTTLLAGGFASQAEAQAACTTLKNSGQPCIVTR